MKKQIFLADSEMKYPDGEHKETNKGAYDRLGGPMPLSTVMPQRMATRWQTSNGRATSTASGVKAMQKTG